MSENWDRMLSLAEERDDANLAIKKAAMAMGSTDEWIDQETMIWDFEERFAALRARVAELEAALNKAAAIALAQMTEHAGCTSDICVGRFNAARDIHDVIAALAQESGK